MEDADRIDYLQGQMQALLATTFALIEMHADRTGLMGRMDQNLEGALAKLGGAAIPEPLLDGFQDMKARLLKYAASAAQRQSSS